MPWTTTIDGKTGEKKTFWLDASFGCTSAKVRNTRCATPTQPVYEVTWVTSRYSEARSARKFDCGLGKEAAAEFYQSKRRKRCSPTWVIHTSGVHEIA